MTDGASPLMSRRRLRTELRAARLSKDLTQEQVARAMDWSLSKMNRIEKAKSSISVNDLRALLPFYGITDKERTEELLALARATRARVRQSSWWRSYSNVAPAELLELIENESAASAVSQFETTFIPGILQTEEYASAVLQVFYEDEKSATEQVAALVDLRTRRRELLTIDSAPRFTFVLDESIIHRIVGSSSVISNQLLYLINVTEHPNVTIQITPFTAGGHPGLKGSFELIQFDDKPDENIVFRETSNGDIISDDSKETDSYLKEFKRITDVSLEPSDSVDRLRKAVSEMI